MSQNKVFFANVIDFIVPIAIIKGIRSKQRSRKEHNMTRNEAKLKLFTTNRQIEAKVNEHTSASSRYKKTSIMNELEVLWARKDILRNIINS